jgi:hypothetical protein
MSEWGLVINRPAYIAALFFLDEPLTPSAFHEVTRG